MPSEIGVVIVSSIASGGFALLGVGLSDRRARRRARDEFRTETALELAGMERHIWETNWIELQVQLQRQEARLAVAGVPDDLVQALRAVSERCWSDLQDHIERSGGDEPGITSRLIEAYRAVHRAIRAYLIKEDNHHAIHLEAIEGVESALSRNPPR